MFAAILAAAAIAVSACPKDQVINPEWREKPTPEDIEWAYPPAAPEKGLEGGATISCEVNVDGVLENCLVLAEQPRGYGFGESALSLAPLMKMSPEIACGVKVRSGVRIPVHFYPPDDVDGTSADPESIALARRLIAAAGHEEALNDRFEQDLQLAYGVPEGDPRLSPDERRAAFEAARGAWAAVKDTAIEPLAKAYAARLSREELEGAVAFFESPIGGNVMQQTRRMVILSRQPLITPKLVDDFRQRYCARVQPCAPLE